MQRFALIGAIAVVMVLGGIAFYVVRRSAPAPPAAADDKRTVRPVERPDAPAPPRAEAAPAAPAAEASARPARRRSAAPPAAAPAAPAVPTLAALTLDSDVAGASVFINREYVGTTPLTLAGLEPGARQVKLAADGYEGIERTIELAAGDNAVTLRFKEVRLNARIGVTHKHGMGSCQGTLVATIDGLAYETANRGDAFNVPYAQVETFAVDYLEKNLKVKQKGGRSWNFTDKTATNADALFVFHRDVEAARKKLAAGYAAVR